MLFVLLLLGSVSCKKADVAGSMLSLSPSEVNKLKQEFPGLSIDLSKPKTEDQRLLSSYEDVRKYLLGIKMQFLKNSGIAKSEMATTVKRSTFASFDDAYTPPKCEDGFKSYPSGTAGNLSTFRANFNFSKLEGISDMFITVTGLAIGWSITGQQAYYSGSNSGCVSLLITFSMGPFTRHQPAHIYFNFDPINCIYTYSEDFGPCGGGNSNSQFITLLNPIS